MVRYILKRIVLLIPVIILVSLIVFTLIELAPGTVIDSILANMPNATPEDIAELEAKYDLDKPMIVRYGKYMLRLIQGDLGVSDVTGIKVWDTYISRLPYTLALSIGGLIVGAGVSIPLGIIAARRAGKLVDNATTTFSMIGMSMPSFWIGILMILLFSHRLGWLPAGEARDGFVSYILPSICTGLMLMATSTRQTRSSMLEVLNSDFLRTARANGVPEKVVIGKYALGNAWIPIITTMGTALSIMVAGSAVIEVTFTWPGVGRMIVNSVLARDATETTGAVIMTTILYVVINLLVDVAYAFVDPRIKSQYVGIGKKKKKAARLAIDQAELKKDPNEHMEAEKQVSPVIEEPAETFETPAPNSFVTVSALQPESADAAGMKTVAASADPRASILSDQRERDEVAIKPPGTEERTQPEASKAPLNTAVDVNTLVTKKYRKRNRMGEVFHHLSKNKGAMIGLIIIVVLILTVLISQLFISFDSITKSNVQMRFGAPSKNALFGTDNMGRDQFLRVIYGTRYSLLIGFAGAALSAFFGVFLGALAGYYGKLADEIIMRFSDTLASLPGLLLGMVIVTVLGPSIPNLIIAVGVPSIPIFIRITRASMLSIKGKEYVEAARAIGLSNLRIIFSYVLPNGLAPIIVTMTNTLGVMIIVGASLSFLGFGVPLPHPEWGTMIANSRIFIHTAPWLTIFPGLFIMITVLAFNLLGDGLRDALDPKQKK